MSATLTLSRARIIIVAQAVIIAYLIVAPNISQEVNKDVVVVSAPQQQQQKQQQQQQHETQRSPPPPPPGLNSVVTADTNQISWARGGHFMRYSHMQDKVTNHKYQYLYAKYLDPVRASGQHIKMLEIGIGCDMTYGPGWSYALWSHYLPNLELYMVDWSGIQKQCYQRMLARSSPLSASDRKYIIEHAFFGDQTDDTFLRSVVAKTTPAGANSTQTYDVIVDDGAHTMDGQLTSFRVLFASALRPGGVYFIEDLQSSYHKMWGATNARRAARETTVEVLKSLIGIRHNTQNEKYEKFSETLPHLDAFLKIVGDVQSIDCDAEICAITKKALPWTLLTRHSKFD
eukprot:PhM_4_TR10962/c1_g2_i1/m.85518